MWYSDIALDMDNLTAQVFSALNKMSVAVNRLSNLV